MKILIIFLLIVALFVLVGMIKINVDFNFDRDKNINCFAKILFFKIKLFPSKKKKSSEKKPRVEDTSKVGESKIKKSNNLSKEKKNKKSFVETVQNIKLFIFPLPKFLKSLNKGFKIKKLRVVWCISTDDACETALKYAKCCGCFYDLLGVLRTACDVELDEIRIFPDFINESPYCIVFFRLQISVGRLFISVLGYLIAIIIKFLNKNKKERLK